MKKIKILFVLQIFYAVSFGQKLNLELKKELDSLYVLDQKYRILLFSDSMKTKQDSIADSYHVSKQELNDFLINKLQKTDSSNLFRVKELINKFGYPGTSLVGTPTNEATFYILQHSQDIDKYLRIIKKAAQKKELPFKFYAMMLDRSLMYKGKEQVYGTQGKGFETMNPQSNQKEFKIIIWPINKPKSVNKRRKKAGFDDTVEENAKKMGIEYIVLTIDEVLKMQNNNK
ncbi:MAG: hypothetical protein RL757_2687 [Bacteroidota bacterium]|jgi:hypothetical protein